MVEAKTENQKMHLQCIL